MRTSKSKGQLEIIELLESFAGTNAELLSMVERQEKSIKTLNERIEKLEYKPTVNRGIRPKDRNPCDPYSHWDYIDPRCYE
jgi:hypothetical protein